MTTVEERLKSLEQEVAGMKALLVGSTSGENAWEKTVGAFEADSLFKEAIRLGREYRESLAPPDDHEGA